MGDKAKPKDPHWKNPDRHGDRYDKMNDGAKPKAKRMPGQKRPKSLKNSLKTGKVQNG